MPYFVVSYDYSAPESDLATVRREHRDYLAALDELVVSGPAASGRAAFLVFRADTAEQVEAIVAADPFVAAGYVGQHTVRDWNPVLGSLADQF